MQSSASATSADAATHDAKCKHKGRSGAKYTQELKSHEFDLRLQLCRYMIIGFLLIYVYACIYFSYSHILALVHLDSQIPRGGVYLTFLYSCSTVRGVVWIG